MKSIDAVVIGGGPSGILAADKLLGASALDVNVTLLDKEHTIGGVMRLYDSVMPNSPHKDLFAFAQELRSEGVLTEAANSDIAKLVDAGREDPHIGTVYEILKHMYNDLLSEDPRFSRRREAIAKNIVEHTDGRFTVEYTHDGYREQTTADVVICAQGASPRNIPAWASHFTQVSLTEALDRDRSRQFENEKVVIVGGSHSAAVALINAVNGEAKSIEVWYRDTCFTPHEIDGSIKKYQFSGINEPTLGALRDAMAKAGKQVKLRKKDIQQRPERAYENHQFVFAHGFTQNPINFTDKSGKTGEITDIQQGETFASVAPNLYYPRSKTVIPRAFGLGLAYPLKFTPDFLNNTVEKPDAKIVGVYFANQLSKLIVPAIIRSYRTD